MEDVEQLKNKVQLLEQKIAELKAHQSLPHEPHGFPLPSAGAQCSSRVSPEEERAAAINSVLYDIIKALNATENLDGLVNSIYDSLSMIVTRPPYSSLFTIRMKTE